MSDLSDMLSEDTVSVDIEDAGPSRKRLRITIPAERVAMQLAESAETFVSEAHLPGFRKGHAPRGLIERRFGEHIQSEARNQLVSSAYSEAVENSKLSVLGEPEGLEGVQDAKLDPGQPLSFSIEVDVAPEFELPQLEGVEILKPTIEVPEDAVDDQIERMRSNEGELVPQESGEPGDFCIGHGVMTSDESGEQLLDLEGAVIQIPTDEKDGRGAVLGVMVDDFAKQVGKPKPGDKLEIKTTGPENHENADVRGKKVTITFDVERVERIQPAPIETLVERFGVADEAALRENIMLQLNRRAVVEQESAMRQQIAQHLIENVELELPERMTSKQVERTLQRQRMEMLYRGQDPTQIEERIAEMRSESEEVAKRELKLFFVLARVADHYDVQVSQDEIIGRISQLAAERNVSPQALTDELVKNRQIQSVSQQIREHKAMDEILSRADVKEVSQEEFNERMARSED